MPYLYLVYYFLGIYLTICIYVFISKKANRFYIMLSLHLIFTTPASYFLAKNLLEYYQKETETLLLLVATILIICISLLLSGIVVHKIKNIF